MKKRILVTGSTGGIGATLCHRLAEEGYDLVLTARSQANLATLASSIRGKHKVDVTVVPTDFSDASTFTALSEEITDGIDGLVVMPPQVAPTEDTLPGSAIWNDIFNKSFVGPLGLVKAVMPALEKRSPSKIVIVSGISSAQVLSHYATSNVLRTAWLAEAKTLAFAYGPKRVHVNTLSLGGVMTEKYTQRIKEKASKNGKTFEEQMSEEVSNVPLRKYATPTDVANGVIGLLSSFSDHITGQNIMCDGGFTRGY
jgi:3-oxoacyl-[acyl-carrier protein] reductase